MPHRCRPHSWRLPCRTLHVSCWIVFGHLARSHSPASTCRKPPATQAGSTPGRPRAATVVRCAAAACGRTCRNSERPRLYRRATQISLDEPDHALRALQRSELFDGWKQAAWPQMHARARRHGHRRRRARAHRRVDTNLHVAQVPRGQVAHSAEPPHPGRVSDPPRARLLQQGCACVLLHVVHAVAMRVCGVRRVLTLHGACR